MFWRSLPNDDVKFSYLRFWRKYEPAAVKFSLRLYLKALFCTTWPTWNHRKTINLTQSSILMWRFRCSSRRSLLNYLCIKPKVHFFSIVVTISCPRCFNFSCPCSQFKNYIKKYIYINLTPNVVCNNVAIPDTKNIVLRISLMTSLLPWKHMGICKMKGIANVDPSMVRKCWKY